MIDMRLPIVPLPIYEPTVVRLVDADPQSELDAVLVDKDAHSRHYDFCEFSLTVQVNEALDLHNEVLLLIPGKSSAHRLVRPGSKHNTFLVTEQCDQLCIMCSQPPKKHHVDLFPQFLQAAMLAPHGSYIGVSGGEPTLHKERLFKFLLAAAKARPDLKFHVLTNGQHFTDADAGIIRQLGHERVLWGVPLYSADAAVHDGIVGKSGACQKVLQGLSLLFSAGAAVELRTVVMKQNFADLPSLSEFVSVKLPFIDVWAIMQMERIGYGRMNWAISFQDTSLDFSAITRAINIAQARGVNVSLYNFPRCSVPVHFRDLAPSTISDWKRAYLDFCNSCSERISCGGFFEWYKHSDGFRGLNAL